MRDLASILEGLVEANASSNVKNKRKYTEKLLNSLSALASEERYQAARRVRILEPAEELDPQKVEEELLRHLVQIYLLPLKHSKYTLVEYRRALLNVKVPTHLGRDQNAVLEAITRMSGTPKLFNVENKWEEIRERNRKDLDVLNRKALSLQFETDGYAKHLATSIGEQLKKADLRLFQCLFPIPSNDPLDGYDEDEVVVADNTIIRLSRILSKLSELRVAEEEGEIFEVSLEEISEDESIKGKEKEATYVEEKVIGKEKVKTSSDDLPIRLIDDAALTLYPLIKKNKLLALTFKKLDAANKLLNILQEEVPQVRDSSHLNEDSSLMEVSGSKKQSDANTSSNHVADRNSSDITQEEETLLNDKYSKAEQGNRDKIDFLTEKLIKFGNALDENKQIFSANRDNYGMSFLKTAGIILAFVSTFSLSHFLWNDFGITDSQGNKFARRSENTLYPKAKK